MANKSGSKAGNGRRAFQDAIDSIHTDTTLTDGEKRGMQALMQDAFVMLGANPDRTYTASYSIFLGANPSLSFSVAT